MSSAQQLVEVSARLVRCNLPESGATLSAALSRYGSFANSFSTAAAGFESFAADSFTQSLAEIDPGAYMTTFTVLLANLASLTNLPSMSQVQT